MLRKLDQLNQIDLANCCWGITKLSSGIKTDHNQSYIQTIWSSFQQLILAKKSAGFITDEQSYSSIIWSFAKEMQGDASFWQYISAQFENFAPTLSNQGLANSVWAFGKMEFDFHFSKTDFQGLIMNRLESFNAEEIMAIAWGSAKLRLGESTYWNALLSKIQAIIYRKDIDISTLSSCAFSLSCLRMTEQQELMWNRIEQIIKQQRSSDQLNLTHIVTFINAFSVKSQGSPELWQLFLDYILQKYIPEQREHEFDSKTFTNILYGFSVKRAGSKVFYGQMVKLLDRFIRTFSIQGLVICFWSLIKQNILKNYFVLNNQDLFTLVRKLIEQLTKFQSQIKFGTTDLGLMMYCFGKMSLKRQHTPRLNELY